ncbi:MAG: hypothetical protein M0Z87_03900 [Actinomycetota bacterium]|nr:hypothetical protein [Actinomycetota bacterium]
MSYSRYYILAGVLGVLALALGLLPLSVRSGLGLVGLLIIVLAAVVAFLAGRTAKGAGAKPVKVGALVGLIYGVLSGISILLAPHLTQRQLVRQLQRGHRPVPSATALKNALSFANSPTLHAVSFVVGAGISVVLGLLIALIGGATAKPRGETGAARA